MQKRNRITITLDVDLEKKLRIKQAKGIKSLLHSYSFSQALNDVVRAGFREEGE